MTALTTSAVVNGHPVCGFIAAHHELVDRCEYGPAVARVSVSVGLTREDLVAALYQWRYTATFEELDRRENVRELVAEAVVNGGLLDLADRRDEVEAVRPGTAAAAWLDSCRTAAADLIAATEEAEVGHDDHADDVDDTAATDAPRVSSDARPPRAAENGRGQAAVDPAVYYHDPVAPVAGSVVASEAVTGRPDADPFRQSTRQAADRGSRGDADAAAVDEPAPDHQTPPGLDTDESTAGGGTRADEPARRACLDEVDDATSGAAQDRGAIDEDPVREDRDEPGPVERAVDDPTAAAVDRARAALAELGSRRGVDAGRAPEAREEQQLARWHGDDRARDDHRAGDGRAGDGRAEQRAGVGDVAGWEL